MSINFKINSKPYSVELKNYPVDITLNEFIRQHAGLTGTKYMCLEGGCGACICVLKGPHPATRKIRTYATNSCLTLLNTLDGLEVITIEGIGDHTKGYHPIQKRLAQLNGTQCGYCSPAMVMNMYGLVEGSEGENLTSEMIENSFGGNICRCTGYRSIMDAMKSFATDSEYDYIDLCKGKIADIEDSHNMKNICTKTGLPCKSGKCQKNDFKVINYRRDGGAKWYMAENYDDIFKAFNEIDTQKYMLVAGNTGHGVYRRDSDISIFIDLNKIMDLHSSDIKENEIRFGGNVNLTEAMSVFTKASKQKNFEYCDVLWKHFDLIANVPVRNMGTLAGNLMMKNANIEFPSDVFLTLEALNAKLIILVDPVKTETMSLIDFIKADMKKKIVKEIVIPSYSADTFTFKSYKIMPRAQNAHAYVNGSFLFEFEDKSKSNRIVKSARICLGGISPEFVHAKNTEMFLQGKDLTDINVIKECFKTLKDELKPDWILPDASPEYRIILACGLLYKCILANMPADKVADLNKSGAEILHRSVSSGKQTFEAIEKNFPLTQPIPKIEALVQCSGEAFYMNDLPSHKNEVYCAFVFATQADSKVVNIDATDALKVDGVEAFYSAKDIPGENNFVENEAYKLFFPDSEEIFCSSEVAYYYQPVGVIAADSTRTAEKAAKLVKIMYEKVNNKIIMPTMKDVFEKGAKDRFIQEISSGDNAPWFSDCFGKNKNKTIKGYFSIESQYHFTMEPQTTVCIPAEDGMDVYTATQWIDLPQLVIAKALKVKQNSIRLQVRRVGGGYGGKISRNCQIAAACALVAHKLNRPTRFVQTIESMMNCIGKRYSCHSDYDVEFDGSGKILKLKNEYYEDGGCTANESPMGLTMACTKNCYHNDEKWKLNGKLVKTDAPSTTWCRGPGALEGVAMIETIMEHIAFATGKDPLDVRMKNIEKTNKMTELLPEFVKSVDYKKRKSDIENFNKENRWRKKGLGLALMKYPIEYFGNFNALVSIFHSDGSVAISHGGIEMGQGLNTKVVQIAAFSLGIPIEKIKIEPSTSYIAPNNIVTGGGVGSESVCFAVRNACETLLNRLKPIKDAKKNTSWEELIHKAKMQNIDLSATGYYKVDDLKDYDVWGLGCSEIEVDILTGNVLLNRVDILEDTGESLSPMIDVGQIEGAFVMGIGYWLSELLVFNRETGEILTNRTWTYKPPGVKDIPVDFRINLVQKSPNPAGFLRSKATGEPAICLSVSVLFAIRHALDSARMDAGLEKKWYHLGAPTTPEVILLNSGTSIEMFDL